MDKIGFNGQKKERIDDRALNNLYFKFLPQSTKNISSM